MHSSTDVLVPLRQRESGIAGAEADLRGWTVLSAGASRLGEVCDLVVDGAGRVRYLEVRLDPNLADLAAAQGWSAPLANEQALPGAVRSSDPAHRLHDVDPTNERRPTGERPLATRQEAVNFAGAERPPDGRPDSPEETAERHLLIPLDVVRPNPQERQVVVEGLRSREVGDLPAYTGGAVTPELETAVRRWFERGFVPTQG
jgi:hypothetical protein